MSQFAHILEEARKDRSEGMDNVKFSNKYFSQDSKFMPKDPGERREYIHSPEFKEIQELKTQLELEQESEEFSGRILVRVPKSLHKALVAEAEREGTSLNQLCLAKLARPL